MASSIYESLYIEVHPMTQLFHIYPEHPQPRLIGQAVEILHKGGVIAYPTDCAYALGCCIGNKKGLDTIAQLRGFKEKHDFTLLCKDLSALGVYARVENYAFRWLKSFLPGPYTFILKASPEVPKRLMHPKKKTIGLRMPNHLICQALLDRLGEPLLTSTLKLPHVQEIMTDPDEIYRVLSGRVDLVINGGRGAIDVTSVVDLSTDHPLVLRRGIGDVSFFES
jgi:tRNA threonylcarbamoyl adenosine modification protein (Sua5/YciO/YrdC/YwlC family)